MPRRCSVPIAVLYRPELQNATTISNLLYMDDIKVYATLTLIHCTRIYSNSYGISFGLDECIQMVTREGKVVITEYYQMAS